MLEKKRGRFMSLLFAGTNVKYTGVQSHPAREIIYFVEGEATVTVGNRDFEVRDGNILVISPGAVHHRRTGEVKKELFFWTDEPIPYREEAEEEGLLFQDDGEGTFLQLMTVLVNRFSEVGKNDTALSLLSRLILELLGEKSILKHRDPVAEEVRRSLLSRYQDSELSLGAVLAATGYQRDHVRRKFQATFGMTPSEYLTSLRIENAKRLLERRRELDLSVSQIALLCGYYDGLYFSRVFKKSTGVSPKDYAAK